MAGKRRTRGEGGYWYDAGRGLHFFSIKNPDPTGGRRKSFSARTKAEALAKRNAYLQRLARGEIARDPRQTLEKFLRAWLEQTRLAGRVRQTTLMTYGKIIEAHLIPRLGRYALANLEPEHVERMQGDMTAEGYAPSYIQQIRQVLAHALNAAIKKQLLARNAALLAQPPKPGPPRGRALTAEQIQRLLDAARDERLHALWILAVMGMRRGELCGLRVQDVDLTTGQVCIGHALTTINGRVVATEPKTLNGYRMIVLPGFVVEALRVYAAQREQDRREASERWQESGYFFTEPDGRPLHPHTVWARFKRLLVAAGLPDIRLHDIRHSAATLMVQRGVPINVVAAILGDNVSTVLRVYAHVMDEGKRGAAAMFERVFRADQERIAAIDLTRDLTQRTPHEE